MDATNPKQTIRRWQYDPGAPPDWRALDATRLAAGERTEWADESDAAVQEYADYLRRIAVGQSDTRLVADAEQSAIAIAHELYREHGLRRAEIEARLVAGQTDEEIAERCHLSPEVVAVYATLFCAVRQCLTAHDYLVLHLLGLGHQGGSPEQEIGRFWCKIALGGDPLVLNVVINVFHAARRPDQPADLRVYLQPDAHIPLSLQAVVASSMLPPTARVAEAFQESHLLLLEAKAAVDPDRAAFLQEKARDWMIRCARAYLAGEPLPRRRRQRTMLASKDASPAGPARKRIPLTFEQWDNMVVAEFSGSRTKKRRK